MSKSPLIHEAFFTAARDSRPPRTLFVSAIAEQISDHPEGQSVVSQGHFMAVVSSRRNFFVAAGTIAASGLVAGLVLRSETPEWARGPKLRDGHPILRMPITRGHVVLCQQGNSSRPGFTHSGGNCLYALDLSNCAEKTMDIAAAGMGRVSLVYRDAQFGDSNAGLRFGNQVKVEHGLGYYSFYSHLERVFVREGDIVQSGALLGTMGTTGAAGNRHLHFSLHKSDPTSMGVPDSIPMRALVTTNAARNDVFKAQPSQDFIAGETDLWSGRIYGSENSPETRMLDDLAPSPELRELLKSAQARLQTTLQHRKALDEFAQAWEFHDVNWARNELDPILQATPGHPIARYWFGTAILLAERDWDAAKRLFYDLLENGQNEPSWEMWLRAWIHNRLGIVALERKLADAARRHFQQAFDLSVALPERKFAHEHLEALRDRN